MEKSPLIAIYRSLDKKELRELGKWLASPVHNQRDDVRALHEYLLGGERLFKTSALGKTRIWQKLFGKQAYDDARLRQTLHFTLKAVEEWLSYQSWRENEVNQRLALASQLRRRKLRKPLDRTLKQLERQQTTYPHRNEHFFRNEYLLQLEHYTTRGAQLRSQKDVKLQAVTDALDNAYLIEKLRHSCNMLFHQRVSKTPYDLGLLESVIEHVEKMGTDAPPGVAIYYFVIKAMTDEADDGHYFERLRTAVRQHGDLLTIKEQQEIYLMAINLCIPKLNAGIEAYTREAFEWYRQGFDKGILLENERLTRYTYLNVAFIAIRLGELKWTEEFLEKYQWYVDENHREQAFGLAKARLYYTKGDYTKTMRLLAQMDFKDHIHNLLSKYLLLKMYYELGEFDALESLLDSLSAYLRRKEIVENQKINGRNIVRLGRALMRLNPYDKQKREGLRKEVETTRPLTERTWFLEQLQ